MLQVSRGAAAVAAQQRRGANRADEPIRVSVGQWGEPGGVVGEDLGGHPAEPEHHQRAEHVVVGHPDDHFGAARDHGLHQDRTLPFAEPPGQPAIGVPHIGLGAQVKLDRARVGLVDETGYVGLDTTGPATASNTRTASSSLRADVSSASGIP